MKEVLKDEYGIFLGSNNSTTLTGYIDNIEFSHSINGSIFYKANIEVPRRSTTMDLLPIIIPSRLVGAKIIQKNVAYSITGQIRSYNMYKENKSKLILAILVQEIFEQDKNDQSYINEIVLQGFVCKPIILRQTPLGRQISEILIAVNRSHNKSSYIPCISWGNTALYSSQLQIGDHIKIKGRFQSREYEKMSDGNIERKVAYEVSLSEFLMIANCEKKIIS